MLDIVLIILGIFAVVIFVEILLAIFYIQKMLSKPPYSYAAGIEHEIIKGSVPRDFIDNFSHVEFKIKSPNGYSLYGRYFLQPIPTNKTAVIMHGHAGNITWSYKYANMFQNMGYNWVIFDDRGCGNSGGKGYTMGFEESTDLVEVINYARKIVPGAQIVLHGESLGASTAILALDKDFGEDIKCVIADCGFSDLTEEVKYQLHKHRLPWFFVGVFGSVATEIKHGFFFRNVSPIKVLQNGRFKTPIYFIHGKIDKTTPVWMAQAMFDAYNGEKQIHIENEAAHARAFACDKAGYSKRVEEFCEKFMGN